MISANEAKKIADSYDDGYLKLLEVQIKKAAEQGKRVLNTNTDLSKYIETLENLGYRVSKFNHYNDRSYNIEW